MTKVREATGERYSRKARFAKRRQPFPSMCLPSKPRSCPHKKERESMLPVLNAVPRVSPPDWAPQAESDSDPDVRQAIARLANNDRTLVWLHLNDRKVDDSGVRVLVDALAQNTSLTMLNLGYNRIGDCGAEALASVLARNRILTELDLNDNQIGASGAQALAGALERNISLTSLDLSRNKSLAFGTQALVHALERNTSLTTLGLSGSKVGVRERATIHAALVRNHQSAHTESQTQFQRAHQAAHAEFQTLLKRVHQSTHSESQTLLQSGQQLAARGEYKLAEEQFRQALRLSGKAKKRSLIQAALDQLVQRPTAVPRVSPPDGATQLESVSDPDVHQAIQRLADKDLTLAKLHLNDKKIGDSDVQVLVDALARNTSLTMLNLSCNQIGDPGAEALAGALAQHRSLTALDLNGNRIGSRGVQALANALEQNISLTSLDLSKNRNFALGARALVQALEQNSSLTTLGLSGSKVAVRERTAIHAALARNLEAVRTRSQTLFQRGQQFAAEGEYQLAGDQFRQALRLGIDTGERSLIQTALDQAIQGLADNDAVLTALDLCLKEIDGSDA
ncbi:hypothetical protein FNU76_01500 [Chitinimonas arctica]|uniref:Tetratricopeptide repeat protein n=2 Tax=Chitinimonas arctica TaxID=2594795 RepID=A0A516SAF9_9NEIS|nr:hypothetical protein FNU76_01500 [Chitinimonas arctica]